MTNCIEFRRRVGTDPHVRDDDLAAHAGACTICAAFANEMRSMDGLLRQAVNVDVPDDLVVRIVAAPGTGRELLQRRGWFALAASVLLGIGFSAGLWFGQEQPPTLLPQALIEHVLHEPQIQRVSTPALTIASVNNAIANSQVSLNGDIGSVRYAGLCLFRGNQVPHLVVNGKTGPINVILLPDETTERQTPFHEDGFRGVLIPVGKGSIAIIGSEEESLDAVSEQFSRSVEFSI